MHCGGDAWRDARRQAVQCSVTRCLGDGDKEEDGTVRRMEPGKKNPKN